MTINEVGDYTVSLLKEFLPSSYHEWEVEFISSNDIAGMCFCHRRVIKISTYVVKHGTDYQIKDTAKHEVAHAIAFTIDNNCIDHGELWKYICYYIGCDGTLSVYIDEKYNSEDIMNYSINLSVPMSSMTDKNTDDDDMSFLPW